MFISLRIICQDSVEERRGGQEVIVTGKFRNLCVYVFPHCVCLLLSDSY